MNLSMRNNRQNQNQITDAASAPAGAASAATLGKQLLCALPLLIFAACVLYITVFSRTPSLKREFRSDLFYSWRLGLSGNRQIGMQVLENIVLFVPLGYLAFSFFSAGKGSKLRKIVFSLLLGLAFSLAIEALQYYSGRGISEFDDLIDNMLGMLLGIAGYLLAGLVFREGKAVGRVFLHGILPALMLLAGLLGCLYMRDRLMTSMTNLRTDQFWFSVDQVDQRGNFTGRCRIYGRETPSFRLILFNGKERAEAEVARDGEHYIAAARRDEGSQYEIRIRFRGYPVLSTGVYLRGSSVEYVEGQAPAPALPEDQPLPPDAVLKAYSAEWDSYVYESGSDLIWLIGESVPPESEVIYHIQSSEPEQLPANRIQYGFDNRGFSPKSPDQMLGSYRCFIRPIPTEYPVSSVIVGLSISGSVVWSASFRP